MQCINCLSITGPFEKHHVVPLSIGGNDIPSNVVCLCINCHNLLHSRGHKGMSVGKLAAESKNYKQAVADGRVGRPKKQLTENQIKILKLYWNNSITGVECANRMKIGRTTLYKHNDSWKKMYYK